MKLTEEQILKLDRAAGLIAEVQIDLLRVFQTRNLSRELESKDWDRWHNLNNVRAEFAYIVDQLKKASREP